MTIVIGLTGNIATGKSTVARLLAEWGAYVIDADQIAHQAIAPDGPAYRAVLEAFGDDLVREDGTVDRQRLAEIVFADPAALARLEAIVHPAVFELIREEIRRVTAAADPNGPQPVIVIEAIKLLEAGLSVTLCDQVWVVTASPEQQVQRLAQRRGMTEREALQRMAAQSPQAEKIRYADVVINNSGQWEDTAAQVRAAWATFVEPRRWDRESKHEQHTTLL
ncbi:MAG: dephospho-CoA kinase [Anaerolineae bacterium]|nr:dephospho-CoA kinase [Anaerolineae bacterium]MDW8099227.1 dephospho-CoA kinase [Anaerolineae bacterium]